MNIGDLFVKLADGTPLSQEEKQQLRLYGNQTQLNNSFVAGLQNGQSDIIVNNISARTGYFDIQPTRGLSVIGSVTVPTSSYSYPTFDLRYSKSNYSLAILDESNKTKLTLQPGAVGSYIVFMGNVFWGSSITSSVRLEQYDSSDALIAPSSPVNSYLTALSIPFVGSSLIDNNAAYLKLGVWQNSGSDKFCVAYLNMFELI